MRNVPLGTESLGRACTDCGGKLVGMIGRSPEQARQLAKSQAFPLSTSVQVPLGTPLENQSLDVAVFCLSLMGTNWQEYLQETHRTLKPFGHLFIAEPQKRWAGRVTDLTQTISAAGFRLVGDVEQREAFLYTSAVRG